MQLTKKQEEALKIAVERYRAGEKYTVIAGYAGCGKAQPVDTIIPTPNGKRRFGDLKPGDYVYDRTGKPTKVLSIHPQGMLDSYIVTFEGGRQTRCNDEHLFSYYTSKGNLATKTVREMLDAGLKEKGPKGSFKFKVPVFQGVEYSEQEYTIDPYVIGAMLGDGCCKESALTISSENEEIPNEVARLVGAGYARRSSENNYNWILMRKEPYLNPKTGRVSTCMQTKEFFADFLNEFCCGASEKRIPEIYKRGSREQRFALLQGLMDADGSISKTDNGRFNITYTSINYNLIQDIQEVLFELGYVSTLRCDKRADKYTTGSCYTLYLKIPPKDKVNFFRLSRKKAIAIEAGNHPKKKRYHEEGIISIEKEEVQREMMCIYVDNPEHLYVTNDYIVTHNTTIVKYIVAALNLEEDAVVHAAYTGKACNVLQHKGCRNVSTLHRLLYDCSVDEYENVKFTLKTTIPYKLIIIDETSMVPGEMVEDLFKFPAYKIFLGDTAQLPPIPKENSKPNLLLQKPHIFLDEIMRQAAESEIIRLSMGIREGKALRPYEGKEVTIIKPQDLTNEMLQQADQILCARNDTRIQINNKMRDIYGFNPSGPEALDKLICLHNYWHIMDSDGNPLTNGTIGTLTAPHQKTFKTPPFLHMPHANVEITREPRFITEIGSVFKNLDIDTNCVVTGKKTLSFQEESLLRRYKASQSRKKGGYKYVPIPLEFTYGYAVTVHKAQGSQWDDILVFVESFPWEVEERKKWLYTAVTRAAKRLTLVLK